MVRRRRGSGQRGWWSPVARRDLGECKTHGEVAENPSRRGGAHQRVRPMVPSAPNLTVGGRHEAMGSGGGARGFLLKEMGGGGEKKK
jgi:hypothetical protein